MTASVVQVVEDSTGNTVSGTIAITLTVTAGNCLLVYAACNDASSTTISGVSDTLNGAYTGSNSNGSLDDINDTVAAERVAQFIKPNTAGGSNTVTVSFSGSIDFRGICVVEVTGVSSNPLDGHTGQNQQTPGTGTDGVTSTNATNSSQPAILIGFSVELGSDNVVNAGTGFRDEASAWNFGGGLHKSARVESKAVTSIGGRAATFTAVANDEHTTFIVVLDESGSSNSNAIFFGTDF